MAKPVAAHPDYGCHHELAIGRQHVHACAEHWMEPIAAVAPVTELPDLPADLTSEIERRRRDLQNTAARKARQRNRQAGAK